MKATAIALAREAGSLLLRHLGHVTSVTSKGDHANIVTEADVASERLIVDGIRRRFPGHSIIAEEMGCDIRQSEVTWVVDPLDGTSNFAAGIPWFGVLIAVVQGAEPIIGVLYLPASDTLYVAEAGAGTECDGHAVSVSRHQHLKDVLWAYGMDGTSDAAQRQRDVRLLSDLLPRVQNIRATNSLVDAAFTADGRLGGMINHSTRVWDIAAPALIVREAGGLYTDILGRKLAFDLSRSAPERQYAVVAGAPTLHRQVIDIIARIY
jgi:myo-inositol-1(or 4)-monophosphatase